MTLPEETSLIFYIVVLAVVAGSLLFGDFRNRFTQSLQHALIWALIFMGAVALYGAKDSLLSQLRPSQAVRSDAGVISLARARDGHFYATLQINGADVLFVVDTGATSIVLTQDDAKRVGIEPDDLNFFGRAETANGVVRTAGVRLETVSFAGQVDKNLRASVNGGNLQSSLLGMTYLSRFSKLEIEGSELRLTP